jgi:hypothetical protein
MSSPDENESEGKGKSSAEWTLGGRFLRQSWQFSAGNVAISGETMMTYDPDARRYRSWMFVSAGAVVVSEGQWDAETRTFTWTGRSEQEGLKFATKATFEEDGNTERWSFVEEDHSGIVMESSGVNVRRDEESESARP